MTYNPPEYWTERLGASGLDLRGVGNCSLSHAMNQQLHEAAWNVLKTEAEKHGIQWPNCRVLDIGCGTGFYGTHLAGMGVKDYTGIDITDVLFPTVRCLLPTTYRLIRCDATKDALPEGPFDVVLMIDVTQHIVDDAAFGRACEAIKNCLAPKGYLFVTSWLDAGARASEYERSRDLSAYEKAFAGWTISKPVRFRDKWLLCIESPGEERNGLRKDD